MNPLWEAIEAAEKAFTAEAVRTSDLSNPSAPSYTERLAWVLDVEEKAKRVYFDSLTEGMKVIPQA